MMNSVTLELENGAVIRNTDFGILLVEYDCPPPEMKVFRKDIDGRSGSIDMSLWAGEPKYADRKVTIKLRDLATRYMYFGNMVYSHTAKITFSDIPGAYFYGRCEQFQTQTRNHVTDITLEFTCQPYAVEHTPTIRTVNAATGGSITLMSKCHAVYPTVVTEDDEEVTATVTVGGVSSSVVLTTGTAPFAVSPTPTTVAIEEGAGTGAVMIQWRDEVIVCTE